MPTSQNRQLKGSDKGIKPQDKVVDVTPLNSTAQSKTSPKVNSTLNKNSSNNLKTSTSKNLSNSSVGGGSSKPPIGKNKAFQNKSNFGIALGMIETRGLVFFFFFNIYKFHLGNFNNCFINIFKLFRQKQPVNF